MVELEIFDGSQVRGQDEAEVIEKLRSDLSSMQAERDRLAEALEACRVWSVSETSSPQSQDKAPGECWRAEKLGLEQSLAEVKAELCDSEVSRTYVEASLGQCQARLEAALAQLEDRRRDDSDRILEDDDIEIEEVPSLYSQRTETARVDGQLPERSLGEQVLDLRAELEGAHADQAELRQELTERKREHDAMTSKLQRYSRAATNRGKRVKELEAALATECARHAELRTVLDHTGDLEAARRQILELLRTVDSLESSVAEARRQLEEAQVSEREARLSLAQLARELEQTRNDDPDPVEVSSPKISKNKVQKSLGIVDTFTRRLAAAVRAPRCVPSNKIQDRRATDEQGGDGNTVLKTPAARPRRRARRPFAWKSQTRVKETSN